MAASCKDLKYPAGPSLAPCPALRQAPDCGALLWHAAPGPSHWSGMGFHPELYHELHVARLLGTWEADARVRTADLREGAILPLEPEAGGLRHRISSPWYCSQLASGCGGSRGQVILHLGLDFHLGKTSPQDRAFPGCVSKLRHRDWESLSLPLEAPSLMWKTQPYSWGVPV